MERLTRSSPRQPSRPPTNPSALPLSRTSGRKRARARVSTLSDALSLLSIAYIYTPLRWTKCVSPVAVYTAPTTVSLRHAIPPRNIPLDRPGSRLLLLFILLLVLRLALFLVQLVPRTSSMVHGR